MATRHLTLERQRLNWRLRLASRKRITVVHGAAECGKTVAIRQYLDGLGTAHATLHVRAEHANAAAFARAFAQTLVPLAPSTLHLLPIAFSSSRRRTQPWDAVAQWTAGKIPASATIVIDQLDRLDEDAPALRFLTRTIDESERNVRWILGIRSTAALPLPRWLAAGMVDASVDEAACRLNESDVVDLAQLLKTDAQTVEFLRVRHNGSIGKIVAALQPAEHPWSRSSGYGAELAALAALDSFDDEIIAGMPEGAVTLLAGAGNPSSLDEQSISRAYAIAAQHGEETVVRGRVLAARALEHAGRLGPALLLYVSANAGADIERIVDAYGFDLMEQGAADIVGAAIAAMPPEARRRNALALMLEATDESFRGRYDVSESWFETATALALDENQRHRIQVAFAIDLLRRGREDARERLEELSLAAGNSADGVLILASLAVAHARKGDFALAERAASDALGGLEHVGDVGIRATAHQRAAFVALASGDAERAERHAELAATLASEHGNDELAAVARSVSHVVAYSYNDDHVRSLDVLAQIERFAQRLGNTFFRRFARIGSYLIFAERGERSKLEKLEAELALEELAASLQHVEQALLPARALRSTWSGGFAGAHQQLAFTLNRQSTAETRALRAAEIALYASVAGHDADASTALEISLREFAGTNENRSVESLRAALLATFAAIILDRIADARALLERSEEFIARWPRWRSFHALLLALVDGIDPGAEAESLLTLLEAMHDDGLGGWSKLFAAIPRDRLARVTARL